MNDAAGTTHRVRPSAAGSSSSCASPIHGPRWRGRIPAPHSPPSCLPARTCNPPVCVGHPDSSDRRPVPVVIVGQGPSCSGSNRTQHQNLDLTAIEGFRFHLVSDYRCNEAENSTGEIPQAEWRALTPGVLAHAGLDKCMRLVHAKGTSSTIGGPPKRRIFWD